MMIDDHHKTAVACKPHLDPLLRVSPLDPLSANYRRMSGYAIPVEATAYTATAPPPDKVLPSSHPFACLPLGWTTIVDPSDGRVYYHNTATGESSWRHPSAPADSSSNISLPPNQRRQQQQQQVPFDAPPSQRDAGLWNKLWNKNGKHTNRNNNRNSSSTSSTNIDPTKQQQQQQPLNATPGGTGLYNEHPSHATRRPDNHQCTAVVSLFLCPPIGLFAIYHSCHVDSCWKQGLYSDSVSHARQAPKFACFGNVVGVCFWLYWIFFREGGVDIDWPDWGN